MLVEAEDYGYMSTEPAPDDGARLAVLRRSILSVMSRSWVLRRFSIHDVPSGSHCDLTAAVAVALKRSGGVRIKRAELRANQPAARTQVFPAIQPVSLLALSFTQMYSVLIPKA